MKWIYDTGFSRIKIVWLKPFLLFINYPCPKGQGKYQEQGKYEEHLLHTLV
jgi:hypothetical protein